MRFRNTKIIISHEGVEVDAGSLWEKRGELMILVDEDQFVSSPYDERIFIPVKE